MGVQLPSKVKKQRMESESWVSEQEDSIPDVSNGGKGKHWAEKVEGHIAEGRDKKCWACSEL